MVLNIDLINNVLHRCEECDLYSPLSQKRSALGFIKSVVYLWTWGCTNVFPIWSLYNTYLILYLHGGMWVQSPLRTTPVIVIIERKHLFHDSVWNSNFWAPCLLTGKGCLKGHRQWGIRTVCYTSHQSAPMNTKGRNMLNCQSISHMTTLL